MANNLVTSNSIVRRQVVHYTINETTNATLYASIVAGTSKLPANSTVTLVSTGGIRNTRMTPDVEQTWSLSESITLSSANVSDALKVKAQIAALTSDSTAAQIVAALQA